MRQIRSRFKHSAIMHDSGMIVRVVNGIAETIKNRFKEKNMQFDVFEVLRKQVYPYRKKRQRRFRNGYRSKE